MGEKILRVKIKLDIDEIEAMNGKRGANSFSHLVQTKLNSVLFHTECAPLENPLEIRRISKRIDISDQLVPKLICVSDALKIRPATYIYKYVIVPLLQEIKAEKEQANK